MKKEFAVAIVAIMVLSVSMVPVVTSEGDTQCPYCGSDSTLTDDRGQTPHVASLTSLPPSPPGACDWTGTWDTDWGGDMQLVQTGNQVTGRDYGYWNGKIIGTISGNILTGRWPIGNLFEDDIECTISPDCNSFTCYWRCGGWGDDCIGTRIAAPTVPHCNMTKFAFYGASPLEHAGPRVAPGSYNVWTTVERDLDGHEVWKSYGPVQLKGGHKYLVIMDEETRQSGVMSIREDDVSLANYERPTSDTAVVFYRNDATISETWYAITVCPATPAGSCDWSGTWQTNWGEMVLSQAGTQVSGTYTHDAGRITGTLSGSTLIGTWSEAPSYSPRNDAGDVQLTIAADCNSFTGIWRYGSSGDWSEDWTGTRTDAAPTTTPTPTP